MKIGSDTYRVTETIRTRLNRQEQKYGVRYILLLIAGFVAGVSLGAGCTLLYFYLATTR